jgi:alkylated DNA repair dioxygenase AlkB
MRARRDDNCSLVFGRGPVGFRVIQAFTDRAEQEAIECWIVDNFFWWKRRQGTLPPAEQYPHDGAIPKWAMSLGMRMVRCGIFPSPPDHVLLRRYGAGDGVHPHVDREEYGPIVAGLTLGSSRMFNLTRPHRRSRLEAMLFPGDLYVMVGAARYKWSHSIPSRLVDTFCGVEFPRTDGFSVTWRYAPASIGMRSWWTPVSSSAQHES